MSRPRAVAMLLALVPLTGCLVTGAVDPAGGGRFTLKMRLVSVAHFDGIKAGLQSPDVVLKSASIAPKKWATFEVECADVRKLPTAPFLKHTTVTLDDGADGTRTLAVALSKIAPHRVSDKYQDYLGHDLTISIELPGDVVRSNAPTTSGRTVSWKWPIDEVTSQPRTDLTVTYRRPAAS